MATAHRCEGDSEKGEGEEVDVVLMLFEVLHVAFGHYKLKWSCNDEARS